MTLWYCHPRCLVVGVEFVCHESLAEGLPIFLPTWRSHPDPECLHGCPQDLVAGQVPSIYGMSSEGGSIISLSHQTWKQALLWGCSHQEGKITCAHGTQIEICVWGWKEMLQDRSVCCHTFGACYFPNGSTCLSVGVGGGTGRRHSLSNLLLGMPSFICWHLPIGNTIWSQSEPYAMIKSAVNLVSSRDSWKLGMHSSRWVSEGACREG